MLHESQKTPILGKFAILRSIITNPLFAFIKYKTNGYLSPTVYRMIYDCASAAVDGHAIDIGPAQGATTISIALGYKKSYKFNKWCVYSIEKGEASDALAFKHNIHKNQDILNKNVRFFRVDKHVSIIMGSSATAFREGNYPTPVSVLSIDADGALDRDFRLFYNTLVGGAYIILDDYKDKINRRGERQLQMTDDEIRSYLKQRGLDKFRDANPLGKEYTTYKFVNYLLENHLIERHTLIRNTFFGFKPKDAPLFTDQHYAEMQEIRNNIETEFWRMRRTLPVN